MATVKSDSKNANQESRFEYEMRLANADPVLRETLQQVRVENGLDRHDNRKDEDLIMRLRTLAASPEARAARLLGRHLTRKPTNSPIRGNAAGREAQLQALAA